MPFMDIGGLRVNLDNVTYMAVSQKVPKRLEIHFLGPEVLNVDEVSPEEIKRILNQVCGVIGGA